MRLISRCLNNQLQDICQRAIQLDELNHKLKQYLPESLAEHCQIASLTKGCLLITTSSAVWATELNYCRPELRDRLRREAGLYQLTSIKIAVVEPLISPIKIRNKKKPELTSAARQNIQELGERCGYEPLKEALYHLAGKDDKI